MPTHHENILLRPPCINPYGTHKKKAPHTNNLRAIFQTFVVQYLPGSHMQWPVRHGWSVVVTRAAVGLGGGAARTPQPGITDNKELGLKRFVSHNCWQNLIIIEKLKGELQLQLSILLWTGHQLFGLFWSMICIIQSIVKLLNPRKNKNTCSLSQFLWRLLFYPKQISLFKGLSYEVLLRNKSMAWCKTAVTPMLMHWSYSNLALSPRNDVWPVRQQVVSVPAVAVGGQSEAAVVVATWMLPPPAAENINITVNLMDFVWRSMHIGISCHSWALTWHS